LFARGDVMAGALGNGKVFLHRTGGDSTSFYGQWVTGARVGLEVRTPVLDIRLEQGFNDAGRSHSFIRIGSWK
jgi:hypothetical protein